MRFINFNEPLNRWSLAVVSNIIQKVKEYTDKHELYDVYLEEVEDNSWSDIKNQRYDITIIYVKDGVEVRQKLLYLKGEIVDGNEFHKRFEEFYKR